ncbi:hypothetical protein ACUN7V_04410 [Quadrisphaera oryzae]|uniref:hypothetical protein n=1 Tax=Quadrisphaera TaxID=317661 RepID=UPI001648E81F|nr:hypothetical protein [Quadrisphaera sp. RL12-1S]MBC3760437.1 hypothetical protein [Quadrisphaera sp. RL12-1S]
MAAIAALTPPVGVALLFWFVMRAVLRADRSEREAMAALDRADAQREAEQRAARERASSSSAPAAPGEVR